MARMPDKRENQRHFASLEPAQRRAIIKAVNRGQPVEVRKHAPLAVGLAQRQKRFWKYSWLLGPALAVLQAATVSIEVGLVNGGVVTLGLLGVSWWFGTRASRAETLNREIAEGRKAPGRPVTAPAGSGSARGSGRGQKSPWWRFWDRSGGEETEGGDTTRADRRSQTSGGHLPKATGRLRGDDGGGSSADTGAGHGAGGDKPPAAKKPPVDPSRVPPGQRPYQPRRKKRRRR